ncbi:bifunctional diaminohydroxyphosphoribosylaminopyrimidine deaminase/5-amino-6-(5-phosphoribosylamino)uracil reductase RibD [Brachybacterium endophyticum]|uniref:Riboflavin biosynthesis protein RibD n=2 Tax=Brachybacterium endophyticum TaxID=2182385 RepID=A0A2U2RM91_9MICO|nr:bifunctional diaminohydroxyphosphoribosylaminopyrimidine deaminase/5-amino-6-(5-phosphoribosylamino)uracil reductase RibD [Brachybacterium endophyticum]
MQRALELAAQGPGDDPNPQVGCVLLDAEGTEIGAGHHRGAGTAHAEVAALEDARSRGNDPGGATAVVTLEPCDHTGRTGPCSRALIDAGIRRVVFALPDPGDASAGGAQTLVDAGIEVVAGVREGESRRLLAPWLDRVGATAADVHIVLKTATSLDGRVAAADGTSRWITGEQAREHAHEVRARTDAIIVGTGTVLADDPSLSARPRGRTAPQPWRVVVGHSPVPETAAVRRDDHVLQVRTHEPEEVVAALRERGIRHAVLEGGPRLATAFLRAGLVDEIHAYLAPLQLGAGTLALGDLGVTTLADAPRWRTTDVLRLGGDVLLTARRQHAPPADPASP